MCSLRKLLLLVPFLFVSNIAFSKPFIFAVIPKEENNPFFIASRDGCYDAAQTLDNVECLFRGPTSVDVRKQDKIISDMIDQGVDGIAIAVTQSEFLVTHSMIKALASGIPIVTYDADFSDESLKEFPSLRKAYIGTNDFELGKALGEQLKSQRPQGGVFVIQSGRPDSPNLNQRVMGVRSALSGNDDLNTLKDPIKGNQGWREFSKPLYNFGQFDRAQADLRNVLSSYDKRNINAVVAVGGWTQFKDGYRELIEPHKQALSDKDIVLIIADTADQQLVYLGEHLAHANVGQNPYEMGKQAILTLHKLVNGQPVEEMTYIPMTQCNQKNYANCTK
ncbi:substrate-binding domain-containing protein [Vibrio ostreicida]|uniref:substrate-binding domain-containing protein n=1 Tax=Vibrio ostreicida TaxID=526588 RepID=UPI003B5A36E5